MNTGKILEYFQPRKATEVNNPDTSNHDVSKVPVPTEQLQSTTTINAISNATNNITSFVNKPIKKKASLVVADDEFIVVDKAEEELEAKNPFCFSFVFLFISLTTFANCGISDGIDN